ncbi:MAG: efflux RND transporter periplasmic adaptor subunit [Gemmatimonadetes bacterium]|nr:efflux RND transporter periplasmic adaptor subunit [Gemmatimonadota bacterium]
MRATFRYALVTVAVGLVGACSGGDESQGGAPGGAPAGGPPGGAPQGMPVDVVAARLDTVVDAIGATGQIEAVQAIDLRPEISGRLVRILAREGSEVRAGRSLFKIDDAELLSQVARLEAERDLAEQALTRTCELMARSASSAADLEQAEASFRSAEAQLQLQQTRLDRTVVRAPFGGVVGERYVSLGDYVTSSDALTTLQTVNPQRASFQVPEKFSQRLAVGQQITFRVASVPGRVFEGTVDFVNPRVQLPGRTITVKAQVLNEDRALKPGMFIEARLATEVRPQAVVVPEDAILPLQGADYVWTVNGEGMAERVQVTLGVRTPGWVEVLGGVEAGTQVVVGGIERMSPGAPLSPNVLER